MTTISIELTPQLLWQAVREMPRGEFESFFGRLVSWKNEQSDAFDERLLLEQLNQLTLNSAERTRLHQLLALSETDALSESDWQEMSELTLQSEQLNAERLRVVAQLARLRQQPFHQLMQELGLLYVSAETDS